MKHNAQRIEIKKSQSDSEQKYYYNVIGDNGEVLSTSETMFNKADLKQTVNKYYEGWPVNDTTEPQGGTADQFLDETSHNGNEEGPEE